jgi:hypothetical protein
VFEMFGTFVDDAKRPDGVGPTAGLGPSALPQPVARRAGPRVRWAERSRVGYNGRVRTTTDSNRFESGEPRLIPTLSSFATAVDDRDQVKGTR